MLSADMSNYTSQLTPDAVQGLKNAGIGHVVVQAVNPPPGYPTGRTREQIQLCQQGGLAVDAYIWLWFDLGVDDIQRKLGLLDGLSIRQLWLDVEDAAASKYDKATTEAKVNDALAACDAFATTSGARTGIYTGRWYWTDGKYMGNTTSYSDRDLWDANYDGNPDPASGYRSYGGWQRVAIKQYQGTTSLAGVSGLDLNVLSPEVEAQVTGAQPPPTPEPEQPQPEQPQPDGQRETPDDWLWATWREAAIQYKAIADSLGQQLASVQHESHPD